jgi:hypothetical protein
MAWSFFFFFGNIPYWKILGDRLLRGFSNAAMEIGVDMLRSSEEVRGALGGSHCRCTGEVTERTHAAEYITAGDSREITRISAECGRAWPVCSQLRSRRIQLPWNICLPGPFRYSAPLFVQVSAASHVKVRQKRLDLQRGRTIVHRSKHWVGQLHSPAHNMAT